MRAVVRKPVIEVRLRARGSRTVSPSLASESSGVGAVDDLAELVAPGGEAGSEVVEDEAEAVAVGDAVDVLEKVEVRRLAVVL